MNFTKGAMVRGVMLLAFAAAGVSMAGTADALVINFAGFSSASGNHLSAQAIFTTSGNTLTIVLINNETTAATNGADVLGGLYFNIDGPNPVLSNGNVTLSSGSSFVKKNNVAASGNPLNNEWMYKSPNAVLAREYGMGSTGFGGFGRTNDTFDRVFHGGTGNAGSNDDYGLVPLAGITVGSSSNVYVRNSVTFTFTTSFAISDAQIRNPLVSYGSAGATVLTPEPASIGVLAAGALALIRRRRNRK